MKSLTISAYEPSDVLLHPSGLLRDFVDMHKDVYYIHVPPDDDSLLGFEYARLNNDGVYAGDALSKYIRGITNYKKIYKDYPPYYIPTRHCWDHGFALSRSYLYEVVDENDFVRKNIPIDKLPAEILINVLDNLTELGDYEKTGYTWSYKNRSESVILGIRNIPENIPAAYFRNLSCICIERKYYHSLACTKIPGTSPYLQFSTSNYATSAFKHLCLKFTIPAGKKARKTFKRLTNGCRTRHSSTGPWIVSYSHLYDKELHDQKPFGRFPESVMSGRLSTEICLGKAIRLYKPEIVEFPCNTRQSNRLLYASYDMSDTLPDIEAMLS